MSLFLWSKPQRTSVALVLCGFTLSAMAQFNDKSNEVSQQSFLNPPFVYRPIATLSDHGVSVHVLPEEDAAFARGYGSVLFSPSPDPHSVPAPAPNFAPPAPGPGRVRRPMALQDHYPPEASRWLPKSLPGEAGVGSYMVAPPVGSALAASLPPPPSSVPDPSLGYMTPAYFDRATEILAKARAQGRFATYYDEVGFPSGMADHTTPEKYRRKVISRTVAEVDGGKEYVADLPEDGSLLGLVAVNAADSRRLDLMPLLRAGKLTWTPPSGGGWTVQSFVLKTAISSGRAVDYNGAVDYMDPEAVQWFIGRAYEPMAQHLSQFFGNTLNMTFFDDVGIYSDDRTWSAAISARFKQSTGRDAGVFYPALWDNIGPDTAAARSALFGARATLLGEGFPRLINEWDDRHGLEASGHTPGNYDLQPEDMNGDPFKFYHYAKIPMADVIFGHGFGRGGFKLISSAADEQDRPIVAAEAFSAGGDVMGYRRLIELFVRGFNRFVTSAVPRAEPVGTPSQFAEWAGRSSLLLQGGLHVADIAILYPSDDLAAFYSFDAKQNVSGLPAGDYISNESDYQAVGEMLVNQVHRDFSFLHPETLASPRVSIHAGRLELANKINRASFRVLILPGQRVISAAALQKARDFYDGGGTLIATSLLPSQSAEFGKDAEVQAAILAIFGIDPTKGLLADVSPVRTSRNGGKAVFVRDPSAETLALTLDRLGSLPDVSFAGNPEPATGNGCFGYIHKMKQGFDIYYFGNSSDTPINTTVKLRAGVKLQIWDPATGLTTAASEVKTQREGKAIFTTARLRVPANSAIFFLGQP